MSAGVIACFCMAQRAAVVAARRNDEEAQRRAHAHDPSNGCPDEPVPYEPFNRYAAARDAERGGA